MQWHQTESRISSPIVVTGWDQLIEPGESRDGWMLRHLEDFGDALAYRDVSYFEGGLNAIFQMLANEKNTTPTVIANHPLHDIFMMVAGLRRPCESGLFSAVKDSPGGATVIQSPRYGYSQDCGFFYLHSERLDTEAIAAMWETKKVVDHTSYTVRFAEAGVD